MMINLLNRLAVLLAVLALMIFAADDVTVAAECEDTYYYALFGGRGSFPTERLRAFDMSVDSAYIYDLPNFPSSWVFIFDNSSDGGVIGVTAAAKSDKYAINFNDLEKFAILRQPKDMSGENIRMSFSAIYMDEKGGSGTMTSILEPMSRYVCYFDVEKIDKCLPKKPRIH